MYLDELLAGLAYKMIGDDVFVTSLCADTSRVKQGCMFFCLRGRNVDGSTLVAKAVGDGAVCIVSEKQCNVCVTQIIVENARSFMALAARNFHHRVSDKLKIVGVTGTNGKTSCTYILDSIFSAAGFSTAVIGTNGIVFGGKKYDNPLTTPDPIDLHFWLEKMYLDGVKIVFMEISAHALHFQKTDGIRCDCALFTSFSQDHLDFFGDMESYGKAKMKLFDAEHSRAAVVNGDDAFGLKLCEMRSDALTYGLENADVIAENCSCSSDGNSFDVVFGDERFSVKSPLCGKFNVYNCLGCAAVAKLFGIPLAKIAEGIENIASIDGRNQTFFRADGARVVVDFAHTPDGIDNILSYLKATAKGRLIVAFGCGGNRDRFKRPLMGAVVSKYCDEAVLTDDNPRYEKNDAITKDVVSGMSCPFTVIHNRAEAIGFALSRALANDTVAVLGKGAEKFQEVKGVKTPFSDVEIVLKLL